MRFMISALLLLVACTSNSQRALTMDGRLGSLSSLPLPADEVFEIKSALASILKDTDACDISKTTKNLIPSLTLNEIAGGAVDLYCPKGLSITSAEVGEDGVVIIYLEARKPYDEQYVIFSAVAESVRKYTWPASKGPPLH